VLLPVRPQPVQAGANSAADHGCRALHNSPIGLVLVTFVTVVTLVTITNPAVWPGIPQNLARATSETRTIRGRGALRHADAGTGLIPRQARNHAANGPFEQGVPLGVPRPI
jgi:hypothetical protein